MPRVRLRFEIHGSLWAYLPRVAPATVEREYDDSPGLKDAIEAIGVAHPEVDLILVNGGAVGFAYRPRDGDRVAVFGIDRDPEHAALPGLVPAPPRPIRFVVDGHLGRLARYLRTLGFDVWYAPNADDAALAARSAEEHRVLLTRDRGLLKRSIVRLGYLVRADEPRRQLGEVVDRYGLREMARPYTRCTRCGAELERVGREAVAEALRDEPRTLRYFESFGRCPACGAIYWEGSHVERLAALLDEVLATAESRECTSRHG